MPKLSLSTYYYLTKSRTEVSIAMSVEAGKLFLQPRMKLFDSRKLGTLSPDKFYLGCD